MANHNHTGTVWSRDRQGNPLKVNRRSGPGTNFPLIGQQLDGETPVIVLCYAQGQEITFDAPDGHTYTSKAWDFVVTGDQDPGGYVADVLINTGGDVVQQLGSQGTCSLLSQRLLTPSVSSSPRG